MTDRSTSSRKKTKKPTYRFSHRFTIIITVVAAVILLIGGITIGINMNVKNVTKMTSTTLKTAIVDAKDLVTTYNYYTGIAKLEDNKQLQDWNIPFTSKRLLYTYQGKALLGIEGEDVEVDIHDHTVEVKCPPIVILSNEIDPASVEVYDESTNIFNPIKVEDVTGSLKNELVKQEEAMKTNGVLTSAQEATKKAIKELLEISGLVEEGYDIVVTVDPSDSLEKKHDPDLKVEPEEVSNAASSLDESSTETSK